MSPESLRIDKLHPDQIDAGCDLLARSFGTTADYVHMFPDPHRRQAALRGFMRAPLRDAQAEDTCWAASEEGTLLGVAAWQAPGRYPWSFGRNMRALPALFSVLRHAPGSFRNLTRFGSNIDAHFPDRPVWYLQVIGVSPDAQGRGIGSRLLEPAVELSDRQQMPCYLETSNPEAVPFYLRAGFEIVEDAVPLMPGGPTYWLMLRPSRQR